MGQYSEWFTDAEKLLIRALQAARLRCWRCGHVVNTIDSSWISSIEDYFSGNCVPWADYLGRVSDCALCPDKKGHHAGNGCKS